MKKLALLIIAFVFFSVVEAQNTGQINDDVFKPSNNILLSNEVMIFKGGKYQGSIVIERIDYGFSEQINIFDGIFDDNIKRNEDAYYGIDSYNNNNYNNTNYNYGSKGEQKRQINPSTNPDYRLAESLLNLSK